MTTLPQKCTLALVTVGALLSAGPVDATPTYDISIAGIDYTISYFEGSYNTHTGMFGLPPIGSMPWWGDTQLAQDFGNAVGSGLGAPNACATLYNFVLTGCIGLAPLFAVLPDAVVMEGTPDERIVGFSYSKWLYQDCSIKDSPCGWFRWVGGYDFDPNGTYYFAYAVPTSTAVPEPGTLALLGLGLAGLGLSRRRKA